MKTRKRLEHLVANGGLAHTPLSFDPTEYADMLEGGELHFVMGDKPSDWAKKK